MKMAEQATTADSRAMQIQMMVMVLWRSGAVQHKHTETAAQRLATGSFVHHPHHHQIIE